MRLTKGTSNAFFPVFTPDGKGVAFFRSAPDASKIFLMSALGGAERKLCDVQSGGTSFSFAPDGQTIVTADRDAAGANGIFLLDVTTCTKTRLTTPPANLTDHTPRFAPDGKSIAFVRAGGWSKQNLFIVPATGGAPRQLTFDASGYSGLAWSADGRRIIFASTRGTASRQLWQVAATGGTPELLLAGGKSPETPVRSPDGQTIAFAAPVVEMQDAIFVISTEGGTARRITQDTASNTCPAWSADGQWLYFLSNRGGASNLWRIASDGSGVAQQITKEGAFEAYPAPDGRTLFYTKARDTVGLWRVSATGGDEQPVPELAEAGFRRSWTVTRQGVYFVARAAQPPYPIKFYDFSTKQVSEVAATDKFPLVEAATLGASADGQTLLYAQDDANSRSIMLAELSSQIK